jgi:REP element-mobilizing transposase RayT
MKYDPQKHHRRSIRLKGYDYSQIGAYFVTMVTKNRVHSLGVVADDLVRLSEVGLKAETFWVEIPNHFPNVELDDYVVMPNHLHGILVITSTVGVEYIQPLPEPESRPRHHEYQHVLPGSIGSVIRSYKSAVTRWAKNNGAPEFQWQRDYYEHVVRNDAELYRIRAYILNNPAAWATDAENSSRAT